jgi:hypothetical protein
MRIGAVLVASAVMLLMAAAALHVPMHAGGYRSPPTPVALQERSREKQFRFQYQQHLRSMGIDPLDWACGEGSIDRVRIVQSQCAVEYITDFSLDSPYGSVQMRAEGDGLFHFADGTTKHGTQALTPEQSGRIRAMFLDRVPQLPLPRSDVVCSSSSSTAVEACLAGTPYLVMRNCRDPLVDEIGDDALEESGLRTESTARIHCL